MLNSPTMLQLRIIRSFVRRNVQGWGRPLAYTLQRLKLAGWFALGTLVLMVIDGAINGAQHALHPTNAGAVFLGFLILFTFALVLGSLWTYGFPYYKAVSQPQEQITGTISAVICNAQEMLNVPQEPFHFITLRQPNGQLRAFAIAPELHDQVCEVGKKVTLSFVPGTEQVVAFK